MKHLVYSAEHVSIHFQVVQLYRFAVVGDVEPAHRLECYFEHCRLRFKEMLGGLIFRNPTTKF